MEIRSPRAPFWLLLAVGLATPACAGNPLSPSDLALLTLTDTFSGAVAVGATAVHPFVGRAAGTVALTLSAVGPDSATLLGLGLGSWDGTACAVQISTTQARVGEVYQATISAAGNFCVSVADAGALLAEATYTVQVTHP